MTPDKHLICETLEEALPIPDDELVSIEKTLLLMQGDGQARQVYSLQAIADLLATIRERDKKIKEMTAYLTSITRKDDELR